MQGGPREDDPLEEEILRSQQSLAGAFRAKVAALERTLLAREEMVRGLGGELAELQRHFDHNLRVIQERDEELQMARKAEADARELLEQKNLNFEERERQLLEKIHTVEKEIAGYISNIKDQADKLKEAKREIAFYKKGYLEEIASFEELLKQKDLEISGLKKEICRVREEDLGAVEQRYESVLAQTKANYTKLADEAREEAAKTKAVDAALLSEKDSQLDKATKEIERLRSEVTSLSAALHTSEQSLSQAQLAHEQAVKGLTATSSSREQELATKLALSAQSVKHLEQTLATLEQKHLETKRKAKDKLRKLEEETEERVGMVIGEYRKELSEQTRELERSRADYRIVKEEMERVRDKARDVERTLKRNTEEVETIVREKERAFQEELHSLQSKLEVSTYKERDACAKADKFEERNRKIADELSKERLRILDLEKENQILIEQVVNLKEALHDLKDQLEAKNKESIGKLRSRAASPNQNNYGQSDPKSNPAGDFGRPSDINPEELEFNMPSGILESRLGLKGRILQSSSQQGGLSKSKSNKGQEGDESGREVEEYREAIRLMKEEMDGAIEQVKTAVKATEEWKLKHKEVFGKWEEAEKEILELRERLVESKGRISSLTIQIQKNQQMLEEVRAERTSAVDEANATKRKAEEEAAKWSRQLESFENKVVAIEKERDELVKTLRRTKDKLNRLEDGGARKEPVKLDIYLAEIEKLNLDREKLNEQVNKKELEIERLRKNLDQQLYRQPKGRDRDKTPPSGVSQGAKQKAWDFNQREEN